ncbi:MAG: hypothetical protein M0P66_16140, partial [Salinivirgaceae bacterium]|nr:hypothetical protein [Salinivirgaceae bacterium]
NELSTLTTTTGTVIYNPGSLFANTTLYDKLSNGYAFTTSQILLDDTASWFKEIKVETEESDGRTIANCNVFSRTSYGSGFDVSKNGYILVDPTSDGASVQLEIPNVLSAKYNIYCVFVPASITDPNDITPTKVKCVLTYISRASGSTFIKNIVPANNVTNPNTLTKMLVSQFDFEYANVIDEEYGLVAVKLKIVNDVTSAEESSGTYSKSMRIDCIIFEPVVE